jgi:hypothetical protein
MLPYLVSDFRWEFGKSDELVDDYSPKVGVSILLAKSGLSGVGMFQELFNSILDLELIERREQNPKEPALTRAFPPSCVCSEEFYCQISSCTCKSRNIEMPDLSTQDGIHVSSHCFRQDL